MNLKRKEECKKKNKEEKMLCEFEGLLHFILYYFILLYVILCYFILFYIILYFSLKNKRNDILDYILGLGE